MPICLSSIIFAYFITKQRFEITISAYIFSFGISYFTYYIASFLVSIVSVYFISDDYIPGTLINYNQPIYILLYTLTFILQLTLAFLLFCIRRFKKGFSFIFNKFTIVVALLFTGTILILATWLNIFSNSKEDFYAQYYLYPAGVLIAGIGIYILIRRLITLFQKKRMQQHREEHLENLLFEKEKEIKQLSEKNIAMQTIIHNFTRRLESMENAFTISKTYKEEFSEEIAVSIDDIKRLSQELQDELTKIKSKKLLPSTNINVIDNLFEYFTQKFIDDNIDCNIAVNGSIIYMVDNIIPQGKLETMIDNHLQDALIAVNTSENSFRSVFVLMGLAGEYYELTIHDSGIPFEVDTLERLGTERVTTHADSDGIGIGFMTTFEIMRECSASLIIRENKPSEVDYSKSVTIRFDGKNDYIIETYRPDDFSIKMTVIKF